MPHWPFRRSKWFSFTAPPSVLSSPSVQPGGKTCLPAAMGSSSQPAQDVMRQGAQRHRRQHLQLPGGPRPRIRTCQGVPSNTATPTSTRFKTAICGTQRLRARIPRRTSEPVSTVLLLLLQHARSVRRGQDSRVLFKRRMENPCRLEDNLVIVNSTGTAGNSFTVASPA